MHELAPQCHLGDYPISKVPCFWRQGLAGVPASDGFTPTEGRGAVSKDSLSLSYPMGPGSDSETRRPAFGRL
ncbi:hypothetical protein ASPFODRAFT_44675 [Aspergillus luchuensis CBS 106.47]|uniref:Uncharacterized protein n=1 Tax=Aspergillus luchuensis (strain CBS 106.47) TaxID=1137211 RepID=A0A1M3TJS7_ASPLC|nr:hypothetical protein ASPFODRAFT_44675 [Aspergillus luchuensis CBS 106.47]